MPTSADHPRIRGEHGQAHVQSRRALWIIPAYAGSTSGVKSSSSLSSDHPRIRGEHEGLGQWSRRDTGSSPHTRGARPVDGHVAAADGIIPAYAGSTGWIPPGRRRCKDHPRIRGEHHRERQVVAGVGGSSPHTRGAPALDVGGAQLDGIIPAYAGSTESSDRGRRVGGDHPRIRGEHSGRTP